MSDEASESPELDPERARLAAARDEGVRWRRWGPYLADRQWGTVREDYSRRRLRLGRTFPTITPASRAYRWGEDGLLGICDEQAPAVLRDRLVERAGPDPQGAPVRPRRPGGQSRRGREGGVLLPRRHAHRDATCAACTSTPSARSRTRSSSRRTRRRGRGLPEYELLDTGVFDENRYFDVEVEYAKAAPEDIAIRISVTNRGPEAAPGPPPADALVPQHLGMGPRRSPAAAALRRRGTHEAAGTGAVLRAEHHQLGTWWLTASDGRARLLVTENETNAERLWGGASRTRAVKDAFHDADRQRRRVATLRRPGRWWDEGRRRLRLDARSRRDRVAPPAACEGRATRLAVGRRRLAGGAATARGGRLLRGRLAGLADR